MNKVLLKPEATNIIASKFEWLDKWILYLTFVPRFRSNQLRSSSCIMWIKIYMVLSTLLTLFYSVTEGKEALELLHDNDTKNNPTIFYVITVLFMAILLIAKKILCIYFYYSQFDYPWYSHIEVDIDTDFETKTNLKSMNCSFHHNQSLLAIVVYCL